MRKILVSACLITSVIAPLSSANAQAFSTFVANTGDTSKNCFAAAQSPTTTAQGPCGSFSRALAQTSDGGYVACVNAGQYGSSDVISKSVTIDCAAGAGSLDGTVFVINAPGKEIRLRNLGLGLSKASTAFAIEIIAAADVYLENVTLTGGQGGIYDRRSGPGKLVVRNSTITGGAGPAIVIAPQSATVIAAVIDGVSATNSGYGLAVAAGARVLVKNSTFSGNATAGVHSDSGGVIEIEGSLIAMNPTGINAAGGSQVSISNSRINSNNYGINGNTTSYGNNKFFGNAASDGTTSTPASLR